MPRTGLATLPARLLATLLSTVLAASSLAACTPAPASTPEPAATRADEPVPVTATVTEGQLGRGSTIAVIGNVWEQADPPANPTTSLEVITPDGVRHPVWSSPLTVDDGYVAGDFVLADWRPELHTALVRVTRDGHAYDTVVSYDLTTGATHEVGLPRRAISAALDPDGTGLLMTLYGKGPAARTVAQDWDGARTRLPGTGGYPMTSVDGRTLVSPAGERRDWSIVDLEQRTATELTPPGTCSPIRWLDEDSVLTSCYADGGNTLRAVHLDGGSTVLGPFHRIDNAGRVDVTQDGDLVRAGGSSWRQAWARRGGVLTQQVGAGPVARVPGTAGLWHLGRAGGGRLLLARSGNLLEAPRTRGVLELFDTATGTRDVLLRLERREAWRSVIGATEVRAWNP